MELPSFDLIWATSEKLFELESVIDELDNCKIFKSSNIINKNNKSRKHSKFNRNRASLYGMGFEADDQEYYKPIKVCCDDVFYTEQEYENHIKSHIQCPFESCPFNSHLKAMRLHKEVVHDSGLFKRIYRDTSDKSIYVWRNNRKRNYPTLERIEAQKKVIQQRIDRGQIFQTQQFGFMNRKKSNMITHSQVSASGEVNKSQLIPKESSISDPLTAVYSDDTNNSDVTNRIFRLVPTDYDSDMNESDDNLSDHCNQFTFNMTEKQNKNNTSKTKQNTSSDIHFCRRSSGKRHRRKRQKKNDKNIQKEADFHGENMISNEFKSSESINNPFASHPLVKLQVQRRKCLNDVNRVHSRPTLLQMLLAEDIRKERNQLMQCIRFVVNKNYFQS